jgi:hypothetical protein
VDFNFHIPSNALIFLLQAALATCGQGKVGRMRETAGIITPGWTGESRAVAEMNRVAM